MVVVEPMEYYAGKSKWDDTIRPQAKERLSVFSISWFIKRYESRNLWSINVSHWKSESDQKPIYYNEDPAKRPPTSGIIDQRREYVNQVRFINYELRRNSFYF